MQLPYRGPGAGRPLEVPLPPDRMPLVRGARPLKRWRWVGAFAREAILFVAAAQVGPARQRLWLLWDRERRELHQGTRLGGSGGWLAPGTVGLRGPGVAVRLAFVENPAVEVVSRHGHEYAWTRKQAGMAATGWIETAAGRRELSARVAIDDTAGYHARDTAWRWSMGVGITTDGDGVAWNLVDGVHDDPAVSERTVWTGSSAGEPGPVSFTEDLGRVTFHEGTELRFDQEACREHAENWAGLLRTRHRLLVGTFSGKLPGAGALAEGYGVMEDMRARW